MWRTTLGDRTPRGRGISRGLSCLGCRVEERARPTKECQESLWSPRYPTASPDLRCPAIRHGLGTVAGSRTLVIADHEDPTAPPAAHFSNSTTRREALALPLDSETGVLFAAGNRVRVVPRCSGTCSTRWQRRPRTRMCFPCTARPRPNRSPKSRSTNSLLRIVSRRSTGRDCRGGSRAAGSTADHRRPVGSSDRSPWIN